MDEQLFKKLLTAWRITDHLEVKAARTLVDIGRVLAHGSAASWELLTFEKVSDATVAKALFLILMGVLAEVGHLKSSTRISN
jgi:hypothetical protein